MNKAEIFQQIVNRVAEGELAFPTSVRLTMKLRDALSRPDCSSETVVTLLQAEPLLSTRVVAMSNSIAFNRSGRNTTDVRTAVQRIGFRAVRALVMAQVMHQLAGDAGSPRRKALTLQLWEHCAHVASLAHLIARRVTGVDPEAAMFAAIVHDIGGFYVLSTIDQYPDLLQGDLSVWLECGQMDVGRAVLRALHVPESVQQAMEVYWEGYLELPPHSLGDTLLLADELAPVPSPLSVVGAQGAGVEARASLNMVIGAETLVAILEESAAEVASLTAALKA